MAANKFATQLHKNCHKIIVILVYTVLEWILILLLLLNSLFSYLIAKFTKYFGLKPSCAWCSRLDQIFDSANSHFDYVCEAHGTEISKLSYCSNHKRLAESKSLCSNCSSSRAVEYGAMSEISSVVALFTRLSEGLSENGVENRCSCCDELLSRKVLSQSLLFKPPWDVLEYVCKNASIEEVMDANSDGVLVSETTTESKRLSQADLVNHKLEFEEKGRGDDSDNQTAFEKDNKPFDGCQSDDFGCDEDDESLYIEDMLLQNAEYIYSDRFICIELIDTAEKPLTNSLERQQGVSIEDNNGAANRRFETVEGSDVDTIGRSSRLMEEYKTRDEEIQKFATPSWEKDNAEAADIEEFDNFPDEQAEQTDSLHQLDKKLRMLEEVESREEDSLDGSIIGEMGVGVESLSAEHLEAKLRAREEVLNALYAELDEERKSAAVAAKETMAMMTKLQEEKAAIQMEALQYQRMMEEQTEYDQEALQLLNDLMIKREKEKKELEKELEIYRNKVLDYEAREKTTMVTSRNGGLRSRNSGLKSTTSTVSNDNLSIDLDCEGEYDDSPFGTHQEHNLDDSLAYFDEERVSILEELKVLEAKIFALHDDETHMSEDAKDFPEDKGTLRSDDHDGKNHSEGKSIDLMAKKLLPLFNANDNEFSEEEYDKEETNQFLDGTEMEMSKILIQEELGHVYERLQALEADKDFLKYCMRSMMKGNNGLALLQEILQHLRDFRSLELPARNLVEIPLSDVPTA